MRGYTILCVVLCCLYPRRNKDTQNFHLFCH